jgi:hypothetical protein
MADAPSDPSPPTPTGRRGALVFLGVVLLVHAVQAVRLFPTLPSIVNDQPVVMVDHAIHEYHGALGARFLREAGTTWGIDPFFMAGYPETPVWDSSSNLAILFQWPAGGYSPRGYKLGLFACSLLAIGVVPLAAWAAGLGVAEAAGATLLAWFYFWAAFPIVLWRSGLFAFTTASAGVGLMLALCVRFDRRPTPRLWLGLAACGALLFFTHVTTPIMLAGGVLAFYAATARRHDRRWNGAILAAAVIAVAANLFWLAPLWRFRGIREGGAFFLTTRSPLLFLGYLLGLDLDGHVATVVLILGAAGVVAWSREGRRALAAAFAGAGGTLFVLSMFGGLWGATQVLEPLRFLTPLNMVMALPAGSALARLARWLARVAGGGWRGGALIAAAGLGLVGAAWAVMPRTLRDVVTRRPLAVGIVPEMTALVEWLRANTDGSARILLEDQLRVLETTEAESVHWTPLLPALLGRDSRQFIGGLYQTAFIRHHRMASFGDFHLGDRTIEQWNTDRFRSFADFYNIGWVVCWSPLSRFWFDHYVPARRVATLARYGTPNLAPPRVPHEWDAMSRIAGPHVAARYVIEGEQQYAIYQLDRPHSFALRGAARIAAVEPNRIELADVVPHEGSVLLSLHWIDGWRTDPPARIRPEPVPFDPVDFVRIDLQGPVARLVLFNGYGRR